MKQSILVTFFLIIVGFSTFAQEITVEIPTLTAPAIGQTIDVPVILTGASESGIPITSCDMNITYSTSALTYVGLVDFSPLAIQSQWLFAGINGTVYANWYEPTFTTSVAFPDGTTLFYIRFTYNGGSSPLSFVKNEFYNAQYYQAPTIAIDGAVNEGSTNKTLNLTGVLPEGLYDGGGILNQAFNEFGPQFAAGVADMIAVELHDATTYSTIEHTALVPLSTTGTATITGIPSTLNGNYRITVKHRNSIETTTANAVSFAGTTLTQSFGDPAEIYGGNLKALPGGLFGIYGGNANAPVDQKIDGSDMSVVDNASTILLRGYVTQDVTGDGKVDGSDMSLIDNNATNLVGVKKP